MQSANCSNLDESVNNAVQQWVTQVDQEIGMGVGNLHGRVDLSLHHLDNLHPKKSPHLIPQPQSTQHPTLTKTPNPTLTLGQELISISNPLPHRTQLQKPTTQNPTNEPFH
jgi:hypothetical protein